MNERTRNYTPNIEKNKYKTTTSNKYKAKLNKQLESIKSEKSFHLHAED